MSYMHSGQDQPKEPRYPWTVVVSLSCVLLGLILLILHFVARWRLWTVLRVWSALR